MNDKWGFFKEFSKECRKWSKLHYRYFDFVGKAINIFLSFTMKFIKTLSNTHFRHICRFERLGYEIEVHTQFPKKQKRNLLLANIKRHYCGVNLAVATQVASHWSAVPIAFFAVSDGQYHSSVWHISSHNSWVASLSSRVARAHGSTFCVLHFWKIILLELFLKM